jgi:hypothetical protein
MSLVATQQRVQVLAVRLPTAYDEEEVGGCRRADGKPGHAQQGLEPGGGTAEPGAVQRHLRGSAALERCSGS